MPLERDTIDPAEVFRGGRVVEQIMRDGQEVWSAAPWPKNGYWGGGTVPQKAEYVADQFVAPERGRYEVEWSVDVGAGTSANADIVYPGGQISGLGVGEGGTSTASGEIVLNEGDEIEFQIQSFIGDSVITGGRWSVNYLGAAALADLLGLDAAAGSKFRVGFAGSSTIQGWGQPRFESTAHMLTAHLVRHVPGANASAMVSQTSGSRNGPTLPGFHFLNAGYGGTTSANYLNSTRRNLMTGWGPDLLVHMVGSNDYAEQMNPGTYKTNMRNAVNAFGSHVKHLLIHQQRREDRNDTGHTWAQYGQALAELADEMPNAYFVDASHRWQDLRAGANDWFQADNIHCTWKGSEGLARAIAEELELETHVGETVWAVDPDSFPAGSLISSLAPTTESLVQLPATSGGRSVRPSGAATSPRTIWFDQSGAAYLDTAAWGEAYAFPMTFYVVVRSFSTNTNYGTAVQPWFSRSVSGDDGWWWAWRDRGTTEVRAALNSAFSGAANYGVNNYPVIIAVHMAANSRAHVWANSREPFGTLAPDRIAEELGPWMKSLRIGANSSAASYMAGTYHEMRWELAGHDLDQVGERMEQLGEKYGVTIY